jgi:amidase
LHLRNKEIDFMSILYRSAFELAEDIKAGKLSSQEVLEFFLARVDKFNSTLNAVVQLDVKRARHKAELADAAAAQGEDWGPLHGVPLTIKDAYATEGIISVNGMPEFESFVPEQNADGVQRYLNAGAIIFGKTNVPYMSADLQSYNDVYGTTNNPWDISRTCGGSSGGAAASVAAGLTPLEFGSDIGGSIRTPSSFNGVFGHKPSFGIVSQRGHLPWHSSLAEGDLWVPGPIGTSAGDLEKAFDILVGPPIDRGLAWKIDLPEPRTREINALRVATWFEDPACEVDAEVKTVLESAANSLEKAGAKVSRDTKPDIDFLENHLVYMQLLMASMNIGAPEEQKQRLREAVNGEGEEALMAGAALMSYENWCLLHERRLQIQALWTTFFKQYDVLLAPVTHVPAFKHDHSEDMGTRVLPVNGVDQPYLNLLFWSGFSLVSYLPATVAPAGRTSENLPVGVQIVGPYLEDRTTLAVAGLLEEYHQRFEPPPGFE